MDGDGQHQNGRFNPYFKAPSSPWNMVPPHQVKEQTNALVMNKKIMGILAERDLAIQERDMALDEKRAALAARDEALQQREKAIADRDKAIAGRDNALAAIHYQENAMIFPQGNGDFHFNDAFTINSNTFRPKQKNEKKIGSGSLKSPKKGKKLPEDLNRQGISEGKKIKTDWDIQETGLNLVNFDESTMPGPVCSCTGVPHQCYKWGNGGWQSSCCTTTVSSYPLPQMPNKRHARVGGRKMSGSVFTKLLSRLASEGCDLTRPLDLKDYWARHGTNRYITIK